MALTLRRRSTAVLAVLAAALSWAVSAPAASSPPRSPAAVIDPALRTAHGMVSVVVSGARSSERAVVKAGGVITHDLPIINGFSAKVPAGDLNLIANLPGARAITLDRSTHVQSTPGSTNNIPSVYKKVVNGTNLAINVLTLLFLPILQATQNRDGAALQAKLDELIKVNAQARNDLIGLEDRDEEEIEQLRQAPESVTDPHPADA